MTDKYFRIIVDSKGAEANVKSFDSAMVGAGQGADKLTATVNRLAAAVSAAISARQIIEYADAWQETQGKIRQVTDSQEELVSVTKKLFAVANDTRAPLEATVDLYTQLRRSTESMGLSQEKVIEITKTINNSMLASGGSAESMKAAITQLGQGLASGALRGEEFNSVAEQAPLLLKAFREETGLTTGELRRFAATGGITTDLIIKALDNYSEAAQKAADAMGQTFGQALTKSRNNAIEFVGASAQITEAVGAAGGAIVYVSEHLKIFQSLIEAVTAIIVARNIPAMVAWIAKASAMVAVQLTQNTATVTSIGLYGAQVTRMAEATVATNALALAGRGASAALALVGGPAGAAMLAAGAVYYFMSQSESAAQTTEKLTQRLKDQADAFDQLSARQAKSKALDVAASMRESQKTVEDLEGKVRGLKILLESDYDDTTAQALRDSLTRTEASLETAEKNTASFKYRLEELNAVISKSYQGPEALANSFDRLATSIATGIPANVIAPSSPAAKKSRPDAPTSSDTLKINLQTKELDDEVSLRETYYKKFEDIERNSSDKTLDIMRTSTAEKLGQERMAFEKSQALIEIDRAKTREDQKATAAEKAAQNAQFDQQERLQARVHQQTILDIKFEAAQKEREFLKQRNEEVDSKSTGIGQDTAALQRELEFQQQMQSQHASVLYDIHASAYDQEKAQIEIKISEETFRENEQFTQRMERIAAEKQAIIDSEDLSGAQKSDLLGAYQDQEQAMRSGHQERLTEIDAAGKARRDDLSEKEMHSRLATAGALGNALMSLGQGHSKKIFKIGQKLALAQAAAALPSAVIQSFENGGGYPWGLIPAGAMLATGLANIQKINSAGSGLGEGGGGSISGASLGGGVSGLSQPQIPSTAATTAAPDQKKSFDIRVEPGLYSHTQVIEITKMMAGSDESVSILSSAQSDAMRRGVAA